MTPPSSIVPLSPEAVGQAAALIRSGGTVAIPTETVYGLAADATNDAGVAAIYTAKGRPSFNPLIVHVASVEMAMRLVILSPLAHRLAEAFWPGPLTMVLPSRPDNGLAPAVTAGLDTTAIRMPAHPAMRDLITAADRPLAAPSANASGSISPTTAAHVAQSLGDRVLMILDGGMTARGLESTIIAPEADRIRLLRPGPVTAQAIASLTGFPVVEGKAGKVEAPGQLASHYAPAKPLRLNATTAEPDEYWIGFASKGADEDLSPNGDLEEAAAALFAALHRADASSKARIAVAPISGEGIGAAINDRLKRAAA